MTWFRTHRPSAWICGLTLLVPLVLYFNALLGLWGMRHAYQSDIDNLIPRIARLRGLIGYESQLRESAELGTREIAELVYPASGDRATVSAALQTSVRQILSDAGLAVSNSQVLPIREKENFDYISIRLTVEGELSALDEALTNIAQFRPLLLVESLEMSSVRSGRSARNGPQKQIIHSTIQLLSLRAVL
jgi:general secretion pathway protein M